MDLNSWFQKGMTADEYINSMTRNKDEMLTIYEGYKLTDEDHRKLEPLREKELRVIALTEDWCGDALLNNPILLRIAEVAGIDVRFVLRDQNLELMDQYLTKGISRSIPIYIFINQEGKEIGVWGPRAPKMQDLVEKGLALLPDQDSPDFQEKRMEMLKLLTTSYQTVSSIWQTVASSIIATLI